MIQNFKSFIALIIGITTIMLALGLQIQCDKPNEIDKDEIILLKSDMLNKMSTANENAKMHLRIAKHMEKTNRPSLAKVEMDSTQKYIEEADMYKTAIENLNHLLKCQKEQKSKEDQGFN